MNEILTLYWQLFSTFFIIGMFTFGGGYAMLSLIESEVVSNHGWISPEAFTDIVGISQMSPGPIGINSATYLGYTVIQNAGGSQALSVLGSVTATFAVVLPSFLVVLWICVLFTKFKSNPYFGNLLKDLRPVVIGMIGAAAVMMMTPTNFFDWTSWLLFVVAGLLSYFTNAGPISLILGAAVAGILIY
ncbi:MAG: chromate transporter [Bacteroidales bacterium]|nr:chromate transporter [Bacteroidales bacterium]